MTTFKQFVENTGFSWFVALILDEKVVDLNIVYGQNENNVKRRAVQYVLPQYKESIKPIIITKIDDFNAPWLNDFDPNMGANGTDDDRENFLKKWFPNL